MRVYLDNCCYNRPFDEQGQLRVRLETEAKLEIQTQMRLGIKSADAIHLSCAVSSGCDWFFTVDRGILQKVNAIGKMRVANPMDYIRETD